MLSKLVLYFHRDVCPRHKLQHALYIFESTGHVAPKSDILRKTYQLVPRKLPKSVSLTHPTHYPSPLIDAVCIWPKLRMEDRMLQASCIRDTRDYARRDNVVPHRVATQKEEDPVQRPQKT